MRRRLLTVGIAGALVCAVAPWIATGAFAQVAENPRDPLGVAIPYARGRLTHSGDHRLEGRSAHLRASHPFLLYQLGRDLVTRQFRLKEGAYGAPGAMTVPLYASHAADAGHGFARFARDHASSCGVCHSAMYREP